jgi:uncharacterized protein (DUF2336 family)
MSVSAAVPRFSRLIELARAPSSETRRELLREVTDLFFDTAESRTSREDKLFDEVLRSVASDLNDEGLVELAGRMADAPNGPAGLVRDLAQRNIVVAQPILQRSAILNDDDLLSIVESHGDRHMRAIAQRRIVSAVVSDAIVSKGDDVTVNTLLSNDGASIARPTMERVVERAQQSPLLHENLLGRHDLPVDLMNEMYFAVEDRLRQVILKRNAATDPTDLELALAKARDRMAKRVREEEQDLRAAKARVEDLQARNALTPAALIGLYRERDMPAFIFGMAELTGLDYITTKSILDRKDMDALAMICRACGMDRPLFVTIAILICGGETAMGRAESFGRLYVQVPIEAAQRAMRFYKVRRTASPDSAAIN